MFTLNTVCCHSFIFLVFFCSFMKKRSQNIRNVRTDDILYFPSIKSTHFKESEYKMFCPGQVFTEKLALCILSWYLWNWALHHTQGRYTTILCNLHNYFFRVLFALWWHLVYLKCAELKPYNTEKKPWFRLMVIIHPCTHFSPEVVYHHISIYRLHI